MDEQGAANEGTLSAMCDPLLVANLILSDGRAYEDAGVDVRVAVDPRVLRICSLAALVFDEVVTTPVVFAGLSDLLGVPAGLEIFAGTIGRLHDAGFVSFDPGARVPDRAKPKVDRVVRFLGEVGDSHRRAHGMAGREDPFLEPPFEVMCMSRAAGVPFVGTEYSIAPPAVPPREVHGSLPPSFALLEQVLAIEVPDLDAQSVEDILDMRDRPGAKEFRRFFAAFYQQHICPVEGRWPEFSQDVQVAWNRAKNEATQMLAEEFHRELSGWQLLKAGASVALDLGGMLPGVGLITGPISAAKDSAEALRQMARARRARDVAWLCLLADLRGRTEDRLKGGQGR